MVYLTDFTGLNVKAMTELRRSLRGVRGRVRGGEEPPGAAARSPSTELPDICESLIGPDGLVFGYDDAVGAGEGAQDFAKEHDKKPVFKLGIMENKVLQPEQIDRIAKLPPREQLLAELAGAFEAPMAMLATALEAKLQEMAGLLDALREKRESRRLSPHPGQ